MVLAQVVLPLAAIIGIVFAGWFAGDVLSHPRDPDAEGTLAAARRLARDHVTRLSLVAGMATIVVLPATAALLWLARDAAEPVAYVSGAMAAGVVAALAAVLAVPALAGQVTVRAVRAADRGTRVTFGLLLWGGAARAVVMALAAATIPAGLFAAYSKLLDDPVGTAALHVAGFPLGTALAIVAAATGAAGFASAAAEPEDAGASLGLAACTMRGFAREMTLFLAASAVTALALAVGGAVYLTTGDAAWAALAPTLAALGLLASIVGFVSLAVWVRLLPGPGGALFAGGTVASVLAASLAAGAVPALIDDGELWIGGAAVGGIAGGWLLLVAVSSPDRWATAFGAAIGAASLGVGAILGMGAGIDAIHGSLSGLVGLGVAAAGLVAVWPFAAMLAGLDGGAQAVAARVGTGDASSALEHPGEPLTRMAASGERRADAYLVAVAIAAVALGVGATLVAARDAVVTLAASDREAYVEAAQAMRLLPQGPEFTAAAVVEVDRFAGALEGAGLTEHELAWLVAANDDQARAFAAVRADAPALDETVVTRLSGSPVPLPHVLSLNLARAPAFGGALLALAGAAVIGATLLAPRSAQGPAAVAGRHGIAIAVVALMVTLLGVAVAGLPWRYASDAAAGWEAAAAFSAALAAFALGGAAVAGARADQLVPVVVAVAAPLSAVVLMPAFVL